MADRPTWNEVLDSVIGREVAALHFACPGRASNFSRTMFTVDVTPLYRTPGATEDLPAVLFAKVVFPGIEWDVQDGETGLLVCCDHDFSPWWDQSQVDAPTRERRNDWGAAVFIPGLFSRDGAGHESLPVAAGVKVIPSDDLRLGGGTATDHVVIDGLLSDLDTLMTTLNAWVGQVDIAAGPLAGTAALVAAIGTITAGIAGGTYEATKVKAL